MDIIRRNTDYALRAMLNLTGNYGSGAVPTGHIALQEDIAYQLTCKLMQRLQKAKLVKSRMGPTGGFELARKPSEINLLQIIEAIQGPVSLNRCLLSRNSCPRSNKCAITGKLMQLQTNIEDSLEKITLNQLVSAKAGKPKRGPKAGRGKGKIK